MIIKLSKVISCSSEHPEYPASNLLEYPAKSSWRCAKSNELVATVILQLAESSCVTGLEIANYRSCIVVIEASTSEEPDNWQPIVNHQFLTHDEAANSRFKDQVQIFTKRELNPEIVKKKFDRIKITCMQSANPRELFGLEFVIFKTEVVVDLGLDVFGRFKLKEKNNDDKDEFKEKYLKLFGQKKKDYKDELKDKINESRLSKFTSRQEENYEPRKKPHLEKLEALAKLDDNKAGSSSTSDSTLPDDAVFSNKDNSKAVVRTLFGDVIPSPKQKPKGVDKWKVNKNPVTPSNKRPRSPQTSTSASNMGTTKRARCDVCDSNTDQLCSTCNLLPQPKPKAEKLEKKKEKVKAKPKKEFGKLFEDVSFALSGYVNPHRDEIRRKALKMGAKYNANPNTTNNKCTHLICAFKNTPKIQQLKGHCKIVGHKFVEDCFDQKKRLPWRRFAIDSNEKTQLESEEEIEGTDSPISQTSIYDQETDDSDSNY